MRHRTCHHTHHHLDTFLCQLHTSVRLSNHQHRHPQTEQRANVLDAEADAPPPIPRAASDDALYERAASRFDQPLTSADLFPDGPVPRSATDGSLLLHNMMDHLDVEQRADQFCVVS